MNTAVNRMNTAGNRIYMADKSKATEENRMNTAVSRRVTAVNQHEPDANTTDKSDVTLPHRTPCLTYTLNAIHNSICPR